MQGKRQNWFYGHGNFYPFSPRLSFSSNSISILHHATRLRHNSIFRSSHESYLWMLAALGDLMPFFYFFSFSFFTSHPSCLMLITQLQCLMGIFTNLGVSLMGTLQDKVAAKYRIEQLLSVCSEHRVPHTHSLSTRPFLLKPPSSLMLSSLYSICHLLELCHQGDIDVMDEEPLSRKLRR